MTCWPDVTQLLHWCSCGWHPSRRTSRGKGCRVPRAPPACREPIPRRPVCRPASQLPGYRPRTAIRAATIQPVGSDAAENDNDGPSSAAADTRGMELRPVAPDSDLVPADPAGRARRSGGRDGRRPRSRRDRRRGAHRSPRARDRDHPGRAAAAGGRRACVARRRPGRDHRRRGRGRARHGRRCAVHPAPPPVQCGGRLPAGPARSGRRGRVGRIDRRGGHHRPAAATAAPGRRTPGAGRRAAYRAPPDRAHRCGSHRGPQAGDAGPVRPARRGLCAGDSGDPGPPGRAAHHRRRTRQGKQADQGRARAARRGFRRTAPPRSSSPGTSKAAT